MPDLYLRRVRITGNYDGDTYSAVIDLGWNITVGGKSNVRLLGWDAPEMRAADPATRTTAQQAKLAATTWFANHAGHAAKEDADWPFLIRSDALDLYGRALATVTCGLGHNIGDDLAAAGLVRAYNGTGPHPWPT